MIAVNPIERTLEVEGLTTFEQIVDATLPYGLVPPVTPELKHITIGGAICGIGIESTCFRHGFVHDSLIEADVLIGEGEVVLCNAVNAHADLFAALPNSVRHAGLRAAREDQVGADPAIRSADHDATCGSGGVSGGDARGHR